MGASLPLKVMEGIFQPNLGSHGTDKILAKPDRVFIVKFHSILAQDEILRQTYVYFGKKPFILKAWSIGQSVMKDMLDKIPTSVMFPGLTLKFLSAEGLSKIICLLSRPHAVEKATQDEAKIRYALVLV